MIPRLTNWVTVIRVVSICRYLTHIHTQGEKGEAGRFSHA